MWGSGQHYGAKCCCVFSCLWVYGSIRGREQPIARACLFPLAIFSYWPCQGPHIHPPTVGSSGLRYNGPWQTTVINPCHLFIQPMKNTCSPLMRPAAPNMLQMHNPGQVVWYLVVPLAVVMAPWGSPARPDFVWWLLNPASKPTIISSSISLYLFSLATAINQMASKPPLKQTHKCCSVHNTEAVPYKPWSIITPSSFRAAATQSGTALFWLRSPHTSAEQLMGLSDVAQALQPPLSLPPIKLYYAAGFQYNIHIAAVLYLTSRTCAVRGSVIQNKGEIALTCLHWSTGFACSVDDFSDWWWSFC